MPFIIAGLGNPGEEYENTRHNTGRIILGRFAKKFNGEFKEKTAIKALVADVEIGPANNGEKVLLVEPNNFMNRSGASIAPLVTSAKKAEKLIVIHDDLDLPLGSFKITFNRGSGGHRGVESIIRAVKTEAFTRIKVGISPVTPGGKLKKPKGPGTVEKHIIGLYKKNELETITKKVAPDIISALEIIVLEGREKAMGEFN